MNLILLTGSFIPKSVLITIIALSVVIVGVIAINIVFIVKIKKSGKSNEIVESEPSVQINNFQATDLPSAVEETAITDNQETGIVIQNGKRVVVRFNRSFTAKLIQTTDENKEFYCSLKNYLLSFKGVKSRVSWKADTFSVGRKQIAKLTIKGKTLNVNLSLNPADYFDAKFKIIDKSDSKTYANVPLCYKVKSNRAVKNAMKLIDEVINLLGLEKIEKTTLVSAKNYPYEDTKVLIEKGLIKVKSVNGEEITDIDNVVSQPFAIHDIVSVQEAHSEITDEVAYSLVIEGSGVKTMGKKYAVNIDVLSSNFVAGDTVDIDALKEKGIVPQKEKAIKVLARGSLDKALTVIADSYSADAIKMIVLVGGTAKLK